MKGKKTPGVMPVNGELVSVSEIAKAQKIKDGNLDYTTPLGVQIKAEIVKGAPVNVKFFHEGDEIKAEFPEWPDPDSDRIPPRCLWRYLIRRYAYCEERDPESPFMPMCYVYYRVVGKVCIPI